MDLFSASALGKYDIVVNTVERNRKQVFEVNREGWTSLMYACFYSHKDIVRHLVTIAPDCVYITNMKRQTALMLACCSSDTEIVKLILRDDMLQCTDINGWNALFYAVCYRQEIIVKLLISYKMNLNLRDNKGKTVLMIAALENVLNIVSLLISYGVDRNILSNEKKTALQYALGKKHYDIAELLSIPHFADLKSLLEQLSLNKYISAFENNNVDLNKFLQMTEEDLKNVGIELLGPRRKMAIVISKLNYLNIFPQL